MSNTIVANSAIANNYWNFRATRPTYVRDLLARAQGTTPSDEQTAAFTRELVELIRQEAVAEFARGYFHPDGSFRWMSNDRAPFTETVERMQEFGLVTERTVAVTRSTHRRQTAAAIAQYRRDYTSPDEEQRAEMRAAFGTDTTVVNIFTGDVTTL